MPYRLVIALFAMLFAWMATPSLAAPEVMSQSSARNTLALHGWWEIQGEGFRSAVHVPSAIPLSGTITRWSRTFNMSLAARPAVALMEFGGVANSAVVRVNGVQVGMLRALTSTRLDVREALVLNGVNRVELDIDDRLTETSVPGGPTSLFTSTFGAMAYQLPIPWEMRPGIVRDVKLVWSQRPIVTDVFATSVLSADLKQVDVAVRIRVLGASPKSVAAWVGVNSGATSLANCVALASSKEELACSLKISNPALWSPEQPTLHNLFVTLFDGPEASDAVYDHIGFRRVEARGHQIFLNNRRLFLRGISRHDLYGDAGFVANPGMIDADLRRIKKLGANYVRAIHYPPDERVARRADEIGLLLSQEIPAWAELQTPAVADIAKSMLRSMIERDYNRPSVIFWFLGSTNNANTTSYFSSATALVKSLDPTRLVSFVFDSPIFQPSDVQRYAQVSRDAGFDFYAQNGYGLAYDEVIRSLPLDYPTVITEWSGSEGSDRGPIGTPGVLAFPSEPDLTGTGHFGEAQQAKSMMDKFQVWRPYLSCVSGSITPCVSGLVFFNWQDVPWNGLPYFMPGHVPVYHSGLVYADRAEKFWPLAAFEWIVSLMPGDR